MIHLRSTYLTILGVSLLCGLALGGTVVSGDIGGTWDESGSPYWVEGDLTIPDDEALVILPGAAQLVPP